MDYLGFQEKEVADAANERLKDGKECGCYKLSAKFNRLGSYRLFEDDTFEVNGLNVDLNLSAETIGTKEQGCCCTEVKVIQYVKNTTKVGTDAVMAWRDARNSCDGWRVDAEQGRLVEPFVSDTRHGNASGLSGGVIDTPGAYKHLTKFEAKTCLVCSKSTNRKEVGKLIGCANWGYEITMVNGNREVAILPPSLSCGSHDQAFADGANAAWDRRLNTNQSKKYRIESSVVYGGNR